MKCMSARRNKSIEERLQPDVSTRDLRRKSVRGAFFMGTAGGLEFAIRLGVTLVLARLLSPEDFGLVAMVMALTGLVDIVKDLGLGTATIQRKNITHTEISSLFWINVSAGAFLAFGFLAATPLISWFYEDDRLREITAPLATTLLWGAMAVQHEALLSRQLKQGHLAMVRLLATLLSSFGGIALALLGMGYWALVAREVARSLIYLLGVWWSCGWIPSLMLRVREVTSYLYFGRDLTFTNTVIAIIGKIDGVLVGKLFGPVALGAFRQAQNLILAPIEQFNGPVLSVIQPALSALQSEPDRYRRYYERVVTFVAMITMPVGIFVAIYAQEITLLILGEKWIQCVPFLSVFAVAAAVRPTIATTAVVLVTTGRSRALLALTVLHSVVLLILMVGGISWGALGVAVAHVMTSVVTIPAKLHYSFKECPVSTKSFLSAVRVTIASAGFMGISLVSLRFMLPFDLPFTSLLMGCVIAFLTYVLPWLLMPTGRAEIRLIIHDTVSSLARRPAPASR